MSEFMHESIVFCITCTKSSQRKFTFAISSLDEFLVLFVSALSACLSCTSGTILILNNNNKCIQVKTIHLMQYSY